MGWSVFFWRAFLGDLDVAPAPMGVVQPERLFYRWGFIPLRRILAGINRRSGIRSTGTKPLGARGPTRPTRAPPPPIFCSRKILWPSTGLQGSASPCPIPHCRLGRAILGIHGPETMVATILMHLDHALFLACIKLHFNRHRGNTPCSQGHFQSIRQLLDIHFWRDPIWRVCSRCTLCAF